VFIFHVTGKAARSGANFVDGIRAIKELARKIQTIHGWPASIAASPSMPAWSAAARASIRRRVNTAARQYGGASIRWRVNTVARQYGGVMARGPDRPPPERDEVMARIAAIIVRSFAPDTWAEMTARGEF
jgi:glutamate carboxypeptidase